MFINLPSSTSSLDGNPVPEDKVPVRPTSPAYFSPTPLFYLKKPHRLLNATNSQEKYAKRLSQRIMHVSWNITDDLDININLKSLKLGGATPRILEAKNRLLRSKVPSGESMTPSKFQIPARRLNDSQGDSSFSPNNSSSAKLVSFKQAVTRAYSQTKTLGKTSKDMSPTSPDSPKGSQQADSASPKKIGRNKSRTIQAKSHIERMKSLFRKSNTVRYSANRKLFNETNGPTLGNLIRRKSCHCSDCGGMSAFEKKHVNLAIPPLRGLLQDEERSASSRSSARYVKSPSFKMESSPKNHIPEEDLFSAIAVKSSLSTNPLPVYTPTRKSIAKGPKRLHGSTSSEKRDRIKVVKKKVVKPELPRKRASPSPTNKKLIDNFKPQEKMATVYNLSAREETPYMLGAQRKNASPLGNSETRGLSSRDPSVKRKVIERENYENPLKMRPSTNSNYISASVDAKQEMESESLQSQSTKSRITVTRLTLKEKEKEKEKEKSPDFLPKLNDPVKLATFYCNSAVLKTTKLKKPESKTQTPLRDIGVKSTYKINDNISASLTKIISGAMSTHLKSRPNNNNSTAQDFSDYMMPNYSAREYSNEKDGHRVRKRSDDPYNIATMSFQSPTEGKKGDRDARTGTNSPRPLNSIRSKLGNIGATPPLSNRGYKQKVIGVATQKSTEESAHDTHNKLSTPTQVAPLDILGVEKLTKAYGTTNNRSSVKKQRIRPE